MNQRFRSLITFLVAINASTLHAQAPSQRELNGFLIGQHKDAIAASFTKLIQADTTPDGWIYRTYLLDRTHHAYMSFKFSHDQPDYTVSVQVAGDSGVSMVPFLGLALGDHRDALVARLGKPSRVEHESDLNLDLYDYKDRNYSVEVDSRGRVSSIQILGDDGFAQLPTDTVPSLDSLARALQRRGDAALQYLAPDVEISRGGKTISFRRGALADLQTDTTEIAIALFEGSNSVAALLQNPSIRVGIDASIRVWEHGGTGWVWKFAAPAPIAEIVFKASAGRWRVWEVNYR